MTMPPPPGHPPGPPVPPPSSPSSPYAAIRTNAVATLLLAALTVGSLAMPWVGYSSGWSGDVRWTGFDIIRSPFRVFADVDGAAVSLQAIQWIAIGLAALAFLRLLAPEIGLVWLSVTGALALCLLTGVTLFRFYKALEDGRHMAPSLQYGAAVAMVAALLCLIVAARAPGADRRTRR
ncbi:hypothetical protein [Streptomyces rubellomurinus]|uniref:hypothetical protein n=1 Tax=Streptomyces rubellomurinus (strain ATCC 31215) TaxID=359131 RepID=UPI000ADDE55F|nr:hypothetical protein [Streptomyces rubellomurinus]